MERPAFARRDLTAVELQQFQSTVGGILATSTTSGAGIARVPYQSPSSRFSMFPELHVAMQKSLDQSSVQLPGMQSSHIWATSLASTEPRRPKRSERRRVSWVRSSRQRLWLHKPLAGCRRIHFGPQGAWSDQCLFYCFHLVTSYGLLIHVAIGCVLAHRQALSRAISFMINELSLAKTLLAQ